MIRFNQVPHTSDINILIDKFHIWVFTNFTVTDTQTDIFYEFSIKSK